MDGKGGQAPVYDLFDTLMSNSTPGGFLFLMRSVLSFKGYDGFLESRKGGGDSGDIKVHVGSLKIKFWDKI